MERSEEVWEVVWYLAYVETSLGGRGGRGGGRECGGGGGRESGGRGVERRSGKSGGMNSQRSNGMRNRKSCGVVFMSGRVKKRVLERVLKRVVWGGVMGRMEGYIRAVELGLHVAREGRVRIGFLGKTLVRNLPSLE